MKVMEGKESNPWISVVHSESDLRRKLRWYILGMIVRACKDEGVEECQVEDSHTDAFKFIDRLNEELIQSITAVGTFSSEQLRCARTNCQKAFLPRRYSGALVSRIHGDYTCCQVCFAFSCPFTLFNVRFLFSL
ncbi:hypothetical protein OESDEN_18945 [Oesophagostomum dentatum]|uniref:Uncharacterized protein n=1 Tax=Oesophagostomum dentatum TaxID=61180 RepID=A0A0B1S8U8_OESDE|nr:hypothetical protein OESDEN_18945 [Oesophagostomum dentatum]